MPEQAYLQECLEYDPESGLLRWKTRPLSMFATSRDWNSWNRRFAGKLAFNVVNSDGYRVGGLCGELHSAHRIIWKLVTGETAKDIDHLNGDPSDNRIANLRSCDHQTNLRNARCRRRSKSGVTGVYWNTAAGKWVAQMRVPELSVGKTFTSLSKATQWRKQKQRELGFSERHGERAA